MAAKTPPTPVSAPLRGSGWQVDTRTDRAVILRRAGSEEPRPSDWRQRLVETLDTIQGVGVVGAKRLGDSGDIHAMGEFVIHPKGFHHLGRTLPAETFQFPVEVDAVCGGVMAVDLAAFDGSADLGSFHGELGSIRFCLGLRSKGWRCLVVPDVAVMDAHTPEPGAVEAEAFNIEFGFDWRAADLDEVRERHAGDGLIWNERFFGRAPCYLKYSERPCLHWRQYEDTPTYRARADGLVQFISGGLPPIETEVGGGGPTLVDIGCGDGLFAHLFARRGYCVTGMDIEPQAIDQAIEATSAQDYPRDPPRFVVGDGLVLPLDDASTDAGLLLDVIEHLPNPSRVLREVCRMLRPGGLLAVVTPEAMFGAWSDAIYHVCEYTHDELLGQLGACGFEIGQQGRIGGPYRDLIVLARKSRAYIGSEPRTRQNPNPKGTTKTVSPRRSFKRKPRRSSNTI